MNDPKITKLREAVRAAWATGTPDFRKLYDDALKEALGIETFSALAAPEGKNATASCPFCGSSNVSAGEILLKSLGNFTAQVLCLGCGACGPTVPLGLMDAEKADDASAAAWNRRVK